jgi:hypothetical protein
VKTEVKTPGDATLNVPPAASAPPSAVSEAPKPDNLKKRKRSESMAPSNIPDLLQRNVTIHDQNKGVILDSIRELEGKAALHELYAQLQTLKTTFDDESARARNLEAYSASETDAELAASMKRSAANARASVDAINKQIYAVQHNISKEEQQGAEAKRLRAMLGQLDESHDRIMDILKGFLGNEVSGDVQDSIEVAGE